MTSANFDKDAFLDHALELAFQAGKRIMEIYNGKIDIAYKKDTSPVTKADEEAEKIILNGLKDSFPSLPIIAEEEATKGNIPEICNRFVLVDPLDGTKEFINRNGAFTVNIALIENTHPVAGIVHAPALKRTFTGIKNKGAYEIKNGTPCPIEARQPPKANIIAVASRSHPDEKTQNYLKKRNVNQTVSIGSSLKFCLLAAGEADLYPRFGRTMEWDTAAGHAILSAAGGHVTNQDGSIFCYGKRNQPNDCDFANPPFLAFGKTKNSF